MTGSALPATLLVLLVGCSTGATAGDDATHRGEALFDSFALSSSSLNLFTCRSCHDPRPNAGTGIKTGAVLAGVVERPSYWGGDENDLLLSIDACRTTFMYANVPLAATDRDAEDLYSYLASLEPGDRSAVPFTVVNEIVDVPHGDATRGQQTFEQACRQCHGAMHTGVGRLSSRVPILPEDTLAAHPLPTYSLRLQRLVFIEKTRHGVFFGYGGDMPPFSSQVMPDTELSDLLEGLGVLGQ